PEVPENAPVARSARLATIERLSGALVSDEMAAGWQAVEWQLYLESLPDSVTADALAALDARFGLTSARNYDVLEKWLTRAIRVGYAPGIARAEEVLGSVGRMKYLRPLYRALAERVE